MIRDPGHSKSNDPQRGRAWLLGACVALAAGLQESMLVRLTGHVSLVGIWPIVFALAFFWRTLEAALFDKRQFGLNLAGLAGALALTLFTSFYYSSFGLVLFPVSLLCFIQIRSPRAVLGTVSARRLRRAAIASVTVLIGAVVVLYPARYLVFGTAGGTHAASYVRSAEDVWRYSARWADFVRPWLWSGVHRVTDSLGIPVGRPVFDSNEMHSFLGLAFLVSLSCATVIAVRRWPAMGRRAAAREPAYAFLAAMFVVAFFTTVEGGRVIHAVLPPIRRFARMAPVVALFGVAFIARVFLGTNRWRLAAALMFAALVLETSSTAYLSGRASAATAPVESIVQKLALACKTGGVRLSPEAPDFMQGPYVTYYVAERSNCQLYGLGGPGALGFARRPTTTRLMVIAEWDPLDVFHLPLSLTFADGSRMDLHQVF